MLIIKKAGISNTPQSERRFLNSKARSYKVRMKNRDERTRVATGPRRSVAILAGYRVLIVDELGYVRFSPTGAELLFQIFSQRYERGSIIFTSNLSFDEWTSVFASEPLTGALLIVSPTTFTSSR